MKSDWREIGPQSIALQAVIRFSAVQLTVIEWKKSWKISVPQPTRNIKFLLSDMRPISQYFRRSDWIRFLTSFTCGWNSQKMGFRIFLDDSWKNWKRYISWQWKLGHFQPKNLIARREMPQLRHQHHERRRKKSHCDGQKCIIEFIKI